MSERGVLEWSIMDYSGVENGGDGWGGVAMNGQAWLYMVRIC